MTTARLLEAVPNFSEGRDRAVVEAIVAAAQDAAADVLDWSADRDHNRSVVTLVGPPHVIEEACVAAARVALERIDLRRHEGVHPRIGALDVLPVVPVAGATLAEARACARRIGQRLAGELGLPVYFYGEASEPPGRGLPELRRGGFEALVAGWPPDRRPDLEPPGWIHPGSHPTAGATCVGARRVLLAWNVHVEGINAPDAREIARSIRQSGGGFRGVRALALALPGSGRLQISMNLEDAEGASPFAVFREVEKRVHAFGGTVRETEIIGMLPDSLVWSAAADRLKMAPDTAGRLLSRRLLEVLTRDEQPSQDE